MGQSIDQTLDNFKHILEFFVAYLYYYSQYNRDVDVTKLPGYDEYIKPHLDNGSLAGSGYGQRRDEIQNLIAEWENLADDGVDKFVAINISARHGYTCTGCYLNWAYTWINIKARWGEDDKTGLSVVKSLYSCHHSWAGSEPDCEFSVQELGLFDDQTPNDNVKTLWRWFKTMLDYYIDEGEGEVYNEKDIYKNYGQLDFLAPLLLRNKNLILNGAPGTGKTYLAKQLARRLTTGLISEYEEYKDLYQEQIELVQFHPSYDYTDFVEGLRPVSQDNGQIGFKLVDGNFKAFCRKAVNNPDKRYVFIIDEINRGEISKIFGELFFALDPDYRGKKGLVKNQYQMLVQDPKDEFYEGFYVPENVYIIGTMNDIDRSIEPIDFAFRRRFVWHEVSPDSSMLMLEARNPTLDYARSYCRRLNQAICEEPCLGPKYQIGPAYLRKALNFVPADTTEEPENPEAALEPVWVLHIEPLLYEYLRGRSKTDVDNIMLKLRNCYYFDNEDDYDTEYEYDCQYKF